jgi:diketogulonate reductase-like aldo/keto reductase
MEAAVRSGQARALGVSNFDKNAGRRELNKLLASATVPPVVAQFERCVLVQSV